MADKVAAGPVGGANGAREAVCIHTKKIYSSCRDKDCIEDLRFYPTATAQSVLSTAQGLRGGSAELIYTFVDVEPVNFNRGYYTVDMHFFYRITLQALNGSTRYTEIEGLATFDKRVVLFGSESGAIEQDERNMIENIFEFNNMTAADVMVHRIDVISIHVDDTREEILKVIKESGLSRFPVYDSDIDDVIGILNTRDFLLNAQSSHPKTVRELLRSAYLVPETVPADTLFSNMQKQKIHLAVVVDEYGGMSGIVTMEDLLEEIVGNIYDEFDPSEENEIEQLGENLWRVDGSVDLDTLSDALHVELPLEEEYDTLGGMVFSTFSSIPEDGSTPLVEINGLKIQVEKICDHRVESALVSKLEPKPAQEEEQEEE